MMPAVDRRTFLTLSAGAGLSGILACGRAPAHAQGTTLRILRLADAMPAGDDVLGRQMADASRTFGAQVTLERIDAGQLAARVTAAVSAGTGPDIIHLAQNGPYLYEQHLVDVSDVADEIAAAQGGFHSGCVLLCRVGDTWRSVPHAVTPTLVAYRESLHEAVGVNVFPKTWGDWYEAGRALKGQAVPIGQTVAQTVVDGPSFWYPYLWCWGAKEVESDGKTVTLEVSATVESVRYAVAFWKDCFDGRGLAWSDTQSARAFLAGTVASTLTTPSTYLTARDDPNTYKTAKAGKPLSTDIRFAPLPGSKGIGQFSYHRAYHHGVMSYSKNQALAKDVLRWLHRREVFEPWFVAQRGASLGPTRMWDRHALWTQDPVLSPFREAIRSFRLNGFSGRPSPKASQVLSSHVVVDMYAKAIRGMVPEDAVKWAADELRTIYG